MFKSHAKQFHQSIRTKIPYIRRGWGKFLTRRTGECRTTYSTLKAVRHEARSRDWEAHRTLQHELGLDFQLTGVS